MDIKLLARIGAVAFVAIVIVISVIQMREAPRAAAAIDMRPPMPVVGADPLAAELLHCQSIGQAGASDTGCLAVWAENRRRFLSPDARSEARLPDSLSSAGARP